MARARCPDPRQLPTGQLAFPRQLVNSLRMALKGIRYLFYGQGFHARLLIDRVYRSACFDWALG